LPWKFKSSVNFQHYTGFPFQPLEVFSGPELQQFSTTVILQPAGTLRLPSVNLLNVRFAREFVFRDRVNIEPMVDLFNLTNAQTVTSRAQTFGGNYLRPSNTINPFLARFGLKVNF
jgi:hypothetical protein